MCGFAPFRDDHEEMVTRLDAARQKYAKLERALEHRYTGVRSVWFAGGFACGVVLTIVVLRALLGGWSWAATAALIVLVFAPAAAAVFFDEREGR